MNMSNFIFVLISNKLNFFNLVLILRREKYVRNYISRYVTSESDLNDKEEFLVNKLKVPAEWIYDYKAQRAKYECLHENQLKLLIKAHKWNEAHNILVEVLGPGFYIKSSLINLNYFFILNKLKILKF
jgi:hypothetical protein